VGEIGAVGELAATEATGQWFAGSTFMSSRAEVQPRYCLPQWRRVARLNLWAAPEHKTGVRQAAYENVHVANRTEMYIGMEVDWGGVVEVCPGEEWPACRHSACCNMGL